MVGIARLDEAGHLSDKFQSGAIALVRLHPQLVEQLPREDGGIVTILHTGHRVGPIKKALEMRAIEGARLLIGEEAVAGTKTLVGQPRPGEIGGNAAVVAPVVRERDDEPDVACACGSHYAVELLIGFLDKSLGPDPK